MIHSNFCLWLETLFLGQSILLPYLDYNHQSLGLPALLGYGKVNHFEFMVMPLYGRTLKEIMLG